MAVHVVRHADAGNGPDDRPLNEQGQGQAERIAEQLAGAGVTRILTSRYPRCLQTVAPLAARLGLEVEVHDDLAEEADPDDAWNLLVSLTGGEAVVCSHGNIISPVLDRVLRRGADIEGEWSCRKGSVWTLEVDGERPFGRAVLSLP
jgi:phosphohistidine phosphatase SixA